MVDTTSDYRKKDERDRNERDRNERARNERARNAALKAEQAPSQRRNSITAPQKQAEKYTNIRAENVDDSIIQQARGPPKSAISNKNIAERDAAEQLGKAKTLLNRAIEARVQSYTRQTEATDNRHIGGTTEQSQHEQEPGQCSVQDRSRSRSPNRVIIVHFRRSVWDLGYRNSEITSIANNRDEVPILGRVGW